MKICIWITKIFDLGGTKRVVSLLANELVKEHEVTIMTYEDRFREDRTMYHLSEDINVDFIDNSQFVNKHHTPAFCARYLVKKLNDRSGLFNKKSLNSILAEAIFPKKTREKWVEYFNSQDYDVILTTASLSLRLAMIAPRLKAATIGWQHNCYDGYLHVKPVVFWQQENLLQQYLPNLDRYIVLSDYDKRDYMEKLGIDCEVKINPRSFVSEKKCDVKSKRFLMATRFVYAKGLDLMMESFEEFCKEDSEWELDIIGDGDLFDQIRADAKKRHLEKRVHFVGYTNEPEKYYLNSSVFLLPSRWEGWPMVIMEAFEFGLPVIAYHMGAMDLIIDDGKTGFLPEAFDPHKFAQAMLKLAHDEELRVRMSANAIAKSDDFSIDKAVKEWDRLFERVVAKKRGSDMKITVNNLKKLVKRIVRPDENSGKEKDTFEAALKRARDEAKYNLTEELREKYADFLDSPIKEKCILYEAFGGRGMTCSPHAIFKYLLTQTEFQEYLHVWVIDDFSDNEPWMGLYRDDPNVKFIKFQSVEYREYLATAKYLINNVSFPGYFTKRKEQIFVDTWHGIPLKTIGFDIPAGKVSAGNTVRNFLAADYLIAPNHFMTEIYENAFKMKNLYPGKILEIGQPRNDSYFHTDREAIFKKLQMAGVEADPKKKLILYAPTWKGSRYSSPDTSLDAYEKMIRTIEENVDTREYQVLVKPHQIVYYHIKDTVGITGQYIPATVDTNELLRATDVLISDYSSIYFDYLVSKKPILFFIPDLAEYKNYRGLYFGIDKLPGPVAETYEQLGDYVKDAERAMEPYRKVYEREAAWACPQDDGEVCRRLADIVFHGKEDSRCIACQDEVQSPKKKLLMYAGDFSEGDDTEAFLGLAENLDFQKYDVTLLVCGGGDDFAEEQIIGLPTGLRILYRGQPFNGKAEEIAKNELFLKGKIKDIPHAFYKREARRLFGEAKFDCAIDLTGKKSLFSVVAKEMEGVRFFQYNARFVREKQIAKELAGQQVIVSATESYFIARYQGNNPAVITVEAIPAPDTEKVNYICMYQQKAQNVLKAFCRLEKNTCLYITGKGKGYQKLKAMVSDLHLEGRVILTGWLEKPFAFMNLCDYFICPEGEEESLGTLAAKTMNMKLLAEDCTTEMPYSFQARSWNQEQSEKLDELIEGKRTSDE